MFMKPLRLLACGLAAACALSSCGYDDRSYGYRTVGYSSPRYVTTYPTHVGPSYSRSGYYGHDSPYVGSGYGYPTSYPRTYTSNRYLAPVTTRAYVSGYPYYPTSQHMSVGGYGYLPPAPRPEPWPLR